MSPRSGSKTIADAKQRLKIALGTLENAVSKQTQAAERGMLETNARRHAAETELADLRQSLAREKSARTAGDETITEIQKRLDEMSGEILSILQRSGAA